MVSTGLGITYILTTVVILTICVEAGRVSDEVDAIISKRLNTKRSESVEEPLSPYELAMFTDLVVQISMIRCPFVSRPAMKSLKRFMFSTFNRAPPKAVSHPLFYSNYRSLVECMNYAQDHFPKSSSNGADTGGSQELYRRRKRSISEEFNSLIPVGQEGFDKFRNEASFKELLEYLQAITELTCPSNLIPNKAFLAAGLTQAATWVKTHEMAKPAHNKYFSRGGLNQQVNQCYQKLRF